MLGRRQTQTVILLSLDTGSKSHTQEFGSFIVLFLALYNSTMHTMASDWVVLCLKLLIDSGSLTRQVHIILICTYCCSHQMRQIGHVTCDNASNNDTMMEFFAIYIEKKTKTPYLHNEWHIQYVITDYIPWDLRKLFLRCLTHVINLATQALIKGHSNSKHYNPAKPNEHLPDTDALIRDEVGLVRAISVKVSTCIYGHYFNSYQTSRNVHLQNGRNFLRPYKLRKLPRRPDSQLTKQKISSHAQSSLFLICRSDGPRHTECCIEQTYSKRYWFISSFCPL